MQGEEQEYDLRGIGPLINRPRVAVSLICMCLTTHTTYVNLLGMDSLLPRGYSGLGLTAA